MSSPRCRTSGRVEPASQTWQVSAKRLLGVVEDDVHSMEPFQIQHQVIYYGRFLATSLGSFMLMNLSFAYLFTRVETAADWECAGRPCTDRSHYPARKLRLYSRLSAHAASPTVAHVFTHPSEASPL